MTNGEAANKFIFTENIGTFLLRRLQEVGLSHVFGVAGDFNLELLEQLEHTAGLEWIGCCNELNAAYAADGYARTHGLSALITTYGVGELSALCGVAGAYAEHVPVISITGAPPMSQMMRGGLLHHTAGNGDYDNMMMCGREFSVAQARLTPQNAVIEIDRCLRACILHKKPVYLQVPSDLAYVKVTTPVTPLAIDFESDPEMLDDFIGSVKLRIDGSSKTTILVDADVARYGQADKVRKLAAKLGCPIAVMGTAKGVIDETDPAYIGLYEGAFSALETREAVESAECIIKLAVRFIDSTTGSFSQNIQAKCVIEINAWDGHVDEDDLPGIYMGDVLDRLLACVEQRPRGTRNSNTSPPETSSSVLCQDWFWKRMETFLREGDVVVAENGTSLSGISGITMPANTSVIVQALWGAIGYSLPATFGSLMAAPERRHVLFIGDGSFQLTAQELSSILRHRLKPIIFLINNGGYTVERLILGEQSSYNDIQPWKYASLCEVFAADAEYESRCVSSLAETESALKAAESARSAFFIEVLMDRMDAPELLRKLGGVYAKQDYGSAWIRQFNRAQSA